MSSIDFSHVHADKKGHVSLAGSRSGFDWLGVIDKVFEAKKAPIDRISLKITHNQKIIAETQEISRRLDALKDVLGSLYGVKTVDNSKDIFEKKTATLQSTGVTDPHQLVSVTASNRAMVGSYDLVINQTAQANKIRTQGLAVSPTDPLLLSGQVVFQNPVDGTDKAVINLSPSDSLLTIMNKINKSSADISVSLVSPSPTSRALIFTSKQTGVDNRIVIKNTSSQPIVESFLGLVTLDGQSGEYTNALTVDEAQNAKFTVGGMPVETASNTVSDVISHVTFDLLKAEADSTIKVRIDRDIGAIQQQIAKFVSAYNDAMTYVNAQDLFTPNAESQPPLQGTSFLRAVRNQLSSLLSMSPLGLSSRPQALGDLGITANSDIATIHHDPVNLHTLKLDIEKLNGLMQTDMNAVRQFFGFHFMSSDDSVGLSVFNTAIQPLESDFAFFSVRNVGGSAIVSWSEGESELSGQLVKVTSGPAAGLQIYLENLDERSDVQISYSLGIAFQMMAKLNANFQPNGLIASKLQMLAADTKASERDKTSRLEKLEKDRASMMSKYQKMEVKMSESKVLMDNLARMLKSDDRR